MTMPRQHTYIFLFSEGFKCYYINKRLQTFCVIEEFCEIDYYKIKSTELWKTINLYENITQSASGHVSEKRGYLCHNSQT